MVRLYINMMTGEREWHSDEEIKYIEDAAKMLDNSKDSDKSATLDVFNEILGIGS